jgi:hypothetical protein
MFTQKALENKIKTKRKTENYTGAGGRLRCGIAGDNTK